jgi:hypothetical protein
MACRGARLEGNALSKGVYGSFDTWGNGYQPDIDQRGSECDVGPHPFIGGAIIMRALLFVTLVILAAGCSKPHEAATPTSDSTLAADSAIAPSADTTPAKADKGPAVTIKPLTKEQQEQLLGTRLEGGMDFSFSQFANMFLVSSRIQIGHGIGLMTSTKEIAETKLQSPFPSFYSPTLREFLDAIALQTFAEWKYDPTSKYLHSEVEDKTPWEGLAIFEFTTKKRERPFEVTLADGWKSIDKGNWLMLVPPSFPVGLDIYEMGSYSSDDKAKEKDLLNKVRTEVALEWAQRVAENVDRERLKPAKVGPYEALSFEAMVPSQLNKELRWRQWVFMAENKCYFVVSTILPDLDDKIFPDVQKMLTSFRAKK